MIHRFWMGPPLPGHAWVRHTVESTQRCEVHDWTFETLPEEMGWVFQLDLEPRDISNRVRYLLLQRFGGLWLDHEVVPLCDLTRSQSRWTAALGVALAAREAAAALLTDEQWARPVDGRADLGEHEVATAVREARCI